MSAIDSINNELYQTTNLALLCEDLVNGMIVAGDFRGNPAPTDNPDVFSHDLTNCKAAALPTVEIILDIEHQDWEFKVQAGCDNFPGPVIFG